MLNQLYLKRVCCRLTQQQLADLSGVSRRTICRLEAGSLPTFGVAVRLCRALCCSLEEVFPSDVLL